MTPRLGYVLWGSRTMEGKHGRSSQQPLFYPKQPVFHPVQVFT